MEKVRKENNEGIMRWLKDYKLTKVSSDNELVRPDSVSEEAWKNLTAKQRLQLMEGKESGSKQSEAVDNKSSGSKNGVVQAVQPKEKLSPEKQIELNNAAAVKAALINDKKASPEKQEEDKKDGNQKRARLEVHDY